MQREVLAVRRLARGHRAPRQQHRRRAAGAEHEGEHDREVVEAQRAGDEVLLRADCQIAQADGGEEAGEGEQRDEHLAHRARAQQPDQEHDVAAPSSATSGDSPAQSMCGPLEASIG